MRKFLQEVDNFHSKPNNNARTPKKRIQKKKKTQKINKYRVDPQKTKIYRPIRPAKDFIDAMQNKGLSRGYQSSLKRLNKKPRNVEYKLTRIKKHPVRKGIDSLF